MGATGRLAPPGVASLSAPGARAARGRVDGLLRRGVSVAGSIAAARAHDLGRRRPVAHRGTGTGSLVVTCLGLVTAHDAERTDLRVAIVAEEQSARSAVAVLDAHVIRSEEYAS